MSSAANTADETNHSAMALFLLHIPQQRIQLVELTFFHLAVYACNHSIAQMVTAVNSKKTGCIIRLPQ